MPRVYRKTKIRLGADRRCDVCGVTIEPGQEYLQWSFRYGGTRYRCTQHPPRPSDLTQSKMSTVYAAIESAEDRIPEATTGAELTDIVNEVAESVQEVAEEYREADEAFGGQGATESAERADELDGFASELEGFDSEYEEAEWDETEHADEIRDRATDDDVEYGVAAQLVREEWEQDQTESLEEARTEAQGALAECPL